MEFLKNKKGVTMIALTITIIVLVIISSITLVDMKDYLQNQKRDRLYSDISNLKAKIDTYYMEHNEIPILGKYCTKNGLKTILANNGAVDVVLDSSDNDNYYVINLAKLDNVTLNYGKEYSNWTSGTTIQDMYIINEKTHQIYYPKGVKFKNKVYYCYEINTTSITVPNITSSININNITISMSKQEQLVATGGKKNLTIDLNISSDTEDITKYVYKYAISKSSANSPSEETFKEVVFYPTTGVGIIETEKLGVGNYYVWIKLTDNIATETDPICVNKDNPAIINESGLTIEEVSNSSGLAELSVKYNTNLLRNVYYSIGEDLENIKENVLSIDSNTSNSYSDSTDSTTGMTTRTYTIPNIEVENYIYVQATDVYGNMTSSYAYISTSAVTIITFTIEISYGEYITCSAEEGMTFGQWVDSPYNTVGAYLELWDAEFATYYHIIIPDVVGGYYDWLYQANGNVDRLNAVKDSDIIDPNEDYGFIND